MKCDTALEVMVKGMTAQVALFLDATEEGEGHEEDWMYPVGQQLVAQQVTTVRAVL